MRTLLVVDDTESVRISLEFILAELGYRVLTAASGLAAIGMLDFEPIDGALIDLHMPVMDGFATCDALKARAAQLGCSLPVWFMTGAFTREFERRCAAVGGLALLRKPFDLDTAAASIAAGLAPPAVATAPQSGDVLPATRENAPPARAVEEKGNPAS